MLNGLRRAGRSRWAFVAATMVTILIGLASRRLAWVPAWVGDLLWATTVYFLISVVAPHAARWQRGLAALAFSFAIEFSQLYHRPWLDDVRGSTLGHLVLGSTFVWTDLVAYAAGVALGIVISGSQALSYPRDARAARH